MEPTQSTKSIVSTPSSNVKKLIIIVLIIVIISIFLLIQRSKTEDPVRVENNGIQTVVEKESKQYTDDINSATSFNNESALKEIDKEF